MDLAGKLLKYKLMGKVSFSHPDVLASLHRVPLQKIIIVFIRTVCKRNAIREYKV